MDKSTRGVRKGLKTAGSVFLLAVFLIGAYLVNNYFFTYPVIVSVLKGAALIGMLAVAESIVLASGGIDLSIAGISLLSSSIMFYLVETGTTGVLAAVLISLAAACAVGILNGLFVAKLGIQPIIVTLGTMMFTHGASGAITNNISIFDTSTDFSVFKSTISFVPVSLIGALAVMMICYFIFRFTVAGRQIFAVGGSEKSAKLSGLHVDFIKIYTYSAAGLIAGIGGLAVLADSTMAARFFKGGAELEIIFAAILGGVSLYSGPKIFLKTFIGAGIIAVINRLLYGLFVFNNMRLIVVGLIFMLIIAIKKNMFKGDNTDE